MYVVDLRKLCTQRGIKRSHIMQKAVLVDVLVNADRVNAAEDAAEEGRLPVEASVSESLPAPRATGKQQRSESESVEPDASP
jgi:hypothetical protein